MKFLSGQWDKIRAQLQGNPRLKWALALIAVLVVGIAWQALDHLRVSSQKQAIADEVNRRRIRSLQGQDIWFSHASNAKALRELASQARFDGITKMALSCPNPS